MGVKRSPARVALVVMGVLSMLSIALGVALATSASATPSAGPRDDGSDNQTKITLTGDLSDTDTFDASPQAYWDLPDPSVPDASYEMTYYSRSLQTDGAFVVVTEVPLYDVNTVPVRPGLHHITVCATPLGASRVPDCLTTGFTVKKGVATLDKTSGRPFDSVTINGTGWSPGNADEEVRVIWDPAGSALNMSSSPFYPSSSTWTLTFSVPGVDPGTYKIRICNVAYTGPEAGSCAKADTVVKSFTVVPATVTLNKSSGKSGDSVKVSGSGFFANYPLYLFLGPSGAKLNDSHWVEILPGASKSMDSNGSFGPYTFTASGAAGDYSVLACSEPSTLKPSDICDTLDLGQAPYTILADATPTPSPTPTATATPTASPTPTPTPTLTASPSPTPSPTPSSSPLPTASPSPIPTAAATASPSAAPTATPAPSAAPTPTPTVAPSPTPEMVPWPEHLSAPGAPGRGLDAATLGTISLLALLIAFLAPFPGTLFNKTVESNYEEIRGWVVGARRRWNALLDRLAVGPLAGLKGWLGRVLSGRLGVLVFIGLSALVYGFLSPTFGLDANSLALFLGLLVGLVLITAAFDLPIRLYHGRRSRRHDRGVLRALWWTLLVAAICVVISRLAGFQPGYLYGLIVSIVFVTEVSTREEGIGTWLASLWLLMLSFVAWIALAFVRQGAFDPWVSLFLQTVLVTFVVAGIETLAVGLLPLRFLPGHPLYRWRRAMWFPLFALAIFGYLLILVDPANGYLSNDSRTPMLIGVIFLVVFGAISIGTWAYFRFRPARIGGDRPGEVAAE